jgi:hypothetical protein
MGLTNVGLRTNVEAEHQWLTPIILDTWEAEIRRIEARQIVCEIPK